MAAAAEAPRAALAARRGCGAAGEPGPPPVLILSHFCPRPFVCFGALRPGASRALPLAVLNPNAEPAAVALPPGPAAERGFLVRPRAFRLQPKEKIVISVIWTPVKEGRVREVLTFVVNDILKHEVILLGNAEEPRKKKRSLWDTIKKKKASASSGHKKRIPNIPSVNQTFSVLPKADRVRSPLQACENLGANEGCAPAASGSLLLQENRIPISPISPALEECRGDACLPLCVRRSTTYTALQAPGSGQLWALGGAPVCQEFTENVTLESSVDSLTDDVNGPMEEAGKRFLTPSCPSTWGVHRSHGDCLSPGSFLRSSHGAGDKPAPATCVSPDVFPKAGSRPRPVEPDTIHGTYQAILSPDSFLKDNYGLSQKLEAEPVNLFVSPNQFVRENMPHLCVAQPTCQLSPLSKENSQAPPSPPGQKESEDLPPIPGSRGSNSPEAVFEEPAALEAMPDGSGFTEQKRPWLPAAQTAAGPHPGAQPPRRPILSATVTKPRPPGPRAHAGTSAPRARRCLRGAVGGCGSPADDPEGDGALRPPLPVIDPAGSSSLGSGRAPRSPQSALTAARKRKSGGSGEDARGPPAGPPEGRESKRTHLCPPEPRTSTARKTRAPGTPGPQRPGSGRRSLPRTRADSLVFKTPKPKTHRRTPRMVPVAQASLTFIKRLKTDVPRHPMPFAAKNVFYDERWKEKQQLALTWWLNFLLTPDDLAVRTQVPEVNAATLLLGAESHHKPSVARAPTKEEVSLRAYTARRRLNRLRHAACRLFTADGMVQAIRKLEGEIAARRLAVRRDRRLWKDVGERQKVLSWLLAYNPLWLRIGLETVFGELIALEDNSDVTGLAVFILSRLLWNPDIAAEYRHPSVPHLYRDGHEEALSAFTLKKFVLLVCFLDRAKLSRLIDHDPCLFCKDAEFKASRDVLLAFSRRFLSGEGDLCRHLSGLGLPVSHVQTPLDEFDFAVTNLAVDLQCGARLVRAVELLTRNWGLSRQLRMPAISRLQKVHNVDLALQALRARGVSLQDEQGSAILAKDIVDRHREKTLALLWRMALAFQVDIALNADELKEEIDYLRSAWRARKSSPAPSRRADTALREQTDQERPESVRLLLEWARAVCAFYGAQVDNFTVSFSDGRLLCYLIHHYHPRCVPLAAIRQRTSQTVECAQSGSVVLNSSSESEDSGLDLSLRALELRQAGTAPEELHRELLENERRNFQLVSSAARDLGGIPAMVQHADMSNTIPDEKVVITYLSFLCARLLDLRRESRAARRIQAAWREHRLRAERCCRQERDRAASVLQAAVRGFLARRRRRREARAALAVQRRWRALCRRRAALRAERERRERARNQAAAVIQRHWRRFSARRRFLRLRHCCVVLQARWRMVAAVTAHRRHLRAAVAIQRRWRALLQGRAERARFLQARAAALRLQAHWRRRRERARFLSLREAAVRLQALVRGHQQLRRYGRLRSAALVIQARFRARVAARGALAAYRETRAAVLVLQAAWRGLRARRTFQRVRMSAVTIQSHYRAHVARRSFLRLRHAAVRLQAFARGRLARRRLGQQRAAAVTLQALFRMRAARRRFLRVRRAALLIQRLYRARQALLSRRRHRQVLRAATCLQAAFRGHRARRLLQRQAAAACTIQAAFRGHRARRLLRCQVVAACTIQAAFRGHRARRLLQRQAAAACTIQAAFRGHRARRLLQRQVVAACTIQAAFRGHRARRLLQRQAAAACTIQAAFRDHRARRLLQRQAAAACTIQAAFRGHRARRLLQHQAAAACTIQAAFRGHRARRLLQRQVVAACTIQAAFRGHRARRLLQRQAAAACTIQAAFRDHRARRLLQRQAAAACTIQAAFRGHRARRLLQRQAAAACTIQAAFRGHRERARRLLRRQAAAACTIQAAFRGHRARRLLRRQAAAAQTIQAAFRGHRARRLLQRQAAAACTIQAAFRGHRERARFRAVLRAAVTVQRWYRACTAARDRRARAAKARTAALALQAAYRGWRVRAQVRRERRAVLRIQAAFCAARARRRFQRLRAAALVLQRRWRARAAGRRQRAAYTGLRRAALTLQAARRGWAARRQIQRRHACAAVIQARFRARRARRRYAACRAAAIAIQRWYRQVSAARQQRRHYLRLQEAAVRMQAAFRGQRARRQLQRMHRAAAAIQAAFRMHRARERFRRARAAAVAIQRRFRARRQGRAQRAQFVAVLRAVRVLQASWRGARAGRPRRAAALIQRCYRGHRARTSFLRLRRAAETAQRRHRAAGTLQAAARGWLVRERLREMHRAAAVVQAAFRAHRAQAGYRALNQASVLVQGRHRACRAARLRGEEYVGQPGAARQRGREECVGQRGAAGQWGAAGQRGAAGQWGREECGGQRGAAGQWGAAGQRGREEYVGQRGAAGQWGAAGHWGAAGQRGREEYVGQRGAAGQWGAARQRGREECVGQRGAAGQWGASGQWGAAGQRGREEYVGQRGAAEVLPATPEGEEAGRRSQEQLGAAVLTQRAHRRHRQRLPHQQLWGAPTETRERHRANENGALDHRALEKAAGERSAEPRPAAGTVQPCPRGGRTGTRSLRSRAAVVVAQRRRRGAPGRPSSCSRLWGPRDFDRRPWATTLIQAWHPMPRARAAYRARRRAAAVPQSHCRSPRGGWALGEASEGAGPPASHGDGAGAQQGAARSPAARPRSGPGSSPAAPCPGEAAGTGPPALRAPAPGALGAGERAALRVAGCPGRSVRRRRAVVPLPLSLRARWARRRVLPRRGAAVTAQDRRRARVSARLRSAIVIQAWARGFLQRRRLQEARASALTIQAAWRSYRERRQARAEEAACRIQAWVRGWQARREYRAVLKAVRAVQGRFRARRARARFLSVRAAAVTIQRRWRATLSARRAREHFLAAQTAEHRARVRLLRWAAAARCHLAAARIQRAYRRHADRRLRAAICIQRWFRARLRLQRFMHIRHSIVALQRQVQVQARGRQQDRAASVIQAAARRFLLRRKQERLRRAAVAIQALWRGYALRKSNDCPRITALRTSLRALSGEVREEDRLCRRTALALHHLLTYRHLSAVLEALRHLEVATRLSPRCCEDMAQSGALRQLFLLIRSCNRSVPCMEVVSYAVQVLLHVAKYERTAAAVSAVDGCVDTLLGLLRMYREKPGDRLADKSGGIFTRTCCLLAVLLRAAGPAAEAQVRSKVAGCVSGIYRLTAQKHRADPERTLPRPSHDSSASLPRLSESPARARPVARLQPDWVLRREAGQEITTPLQAAQLVMDTLGLPYP
ncbi:abnormal spindle-like microcephaly-associated protein isoform X2 [Pipistrellus kuhlii]|uniref:Abnormal spindle-like microcephaly-associated protein homolog n=1 Tax=Pipistrellus kuhlii TaxID=59472 RepID=A0A7J7RJW6_PIPKU|nr:abnormal spindle-like microcephaly-associated protein isoform X2 [Pipistrellus kuhlii]KAF6276383.1 hypothetical protein mPipKuh1_001099 [Pipistrellus kuhlii]